MLFNQQAYALLEQFEVKLIANMLLSQVLHAEEAGINITGKALATLPLKSKVDPVLRLCQAGLQSHIREECVAQVYRILYHDWKPYFHLNCLHALCNAHHLRELIYVEEQDQ